MMRMRAARFIRMGLLAGLFGCGGSGKSEVDSGVAPSHRPVAESSASSTTTAAAAATAVASSAPSGSGAGLAPADTAGAEVVVDGPMTLLVRPAKSEYGQIHEKALSRKERGFDKLVMTVDKMFVMPRPVPVVFTNCGVANGFYKYTPEKAQITMCYELLEDFDNKAKKAKPDWSEKERMTYVVNNTVFVFMHELGHALHKELKLPITGKGEDAADELATLMMVKSEQGEKIALAAAYGHELSANAKTAAGLKPAYWDEHSLSEQRFHSILCLLYGADPGKYEKALVAYKVPKSRMGKCKAEYEDKREAWNTLLKPHAMNNFKL